MDLIMQNMGRLSGDGSLNPTTGNDGSIAGSIYM